MSEALVLTLPETLFLIGGLILLALPGAVTDYRSGKIRNSLIIVLLFLVFIGVYVVWSQLDTAFWMTSGIVLGFGYLLYLYDRWGAGDGKYFIVLGFLILLLERFLKISSSGLLWFTLLSFG